MQEKTCQKKLIFMHKKDNFQIDKFEIQTKLLGTLGWANKDLKFFLAKSPGLR